MENGTFSTRFATKGNARNRILAFGDTVLMEMIRIFRRVFPTNCVQQKVYQRIAFSKRFVSELLSAKSSFLHRALIGTFKVLLHFNELLLALPKRSPQRDLPKGISPKGSPKGISPKEYPNLSTNCFKQLSLLLPSPIINTDPKLFGTYQRIGSVPSLWGDPFGRSLWGPTGSHTVRMESHGNAISPHRIPWDFMDFPPPPPPPPPLRRPP